MSSRHQPENGADSEWVNPFDLSCDQCARTVFDGRLHHWDGKRVCAACAVNLSGEPACDICSIPSFGDYRRVSRGKSIANVCGMCLDKWAAA